MIKILRCFCVVCLLLYIPIVIYGRSNNTKMDMEKYVSEASYAISQDSIYDFYPEFKEKITYSEDINNLEDLMEVSDLVLKVKAIGMSTAGLDMVTDVVIEDIIKGTGLKEDQSIKVFDYILAYSAGDKGTITYFQGNRPLAKNTTYIVFLQKAPSSVIPNSYVYSTLNYGSFRITNTPNILDDLDVNKQISILKAMEYDYIKFKDENHDTTWDKLISEIYKKFH